MRRGTRTSLPVGAGSSTGRYLLGPLQGTPDAGVDAPIAGQVFLHYWIRSWGHGVHQISLMAQAVGTDLTYWADVTAGAAILRVTSKVNLAAVLVHAVAVAESGVTTRDYTGAHGAERGRICQYTDIAARAAVVDVG